MEKGYQEAFPPDGIGTWFSTSLLSRLIRPLSSVLSSSLHLFFHRLITTTWLTTIVWHG